MSFWIILIRILLMSFTVLILFAVIRAVKRRSSDLESAVMKLTDLNKEEIEKEVKMREKDKFFN